MSLSHHHIITTTKRLPPSYPTPSHQANIMPDRRRGSSVEEKPPEQRWCRKEACEIQYCLARENYQEDKCRHKIEAWEKCAQQARKRES